MKNTFNPEAQKKKLRLLLLLFFLIFTIPVYFLLQTVYEQLETEAYFTARHDAEKLLDRLELKLQDLLIVEQQRPSAEYSFFNVLENPLLDSSAIKFSPLSEIPPQTRISGMVGYFQINPDGSFQIPALPELRQDNDSGLSLKELENRLALKQRLQGLLTTQQQSPAVSKSQLSAQTKKQDQEEVGIAHDEQYIVGQIDKRLNQQNKVSAEKEKSVYKQQTSTPTSQRSRKKNSAPSKLLRQYQTRKEQVQLPDQSMASSFFKRKQSTPAKIELKDALSEQDSAETAANASSLANDIINIASFESEVTPLQLLLINQDYFCFYRYVWHDNSRYTQGFVVNIQEFFEAVTQPLFTQSNIDSLVLRHNGDLLRQFVFSDSTSQNNLYGRFLNTPFNQLELIVNSSQTNLGPGSLIIDILTATIALTLILGLLFFYRLLSQQIELSRQQQNFISAVSHELKTPLTSIRMYGEMLRSGWVSEDTKKRQYYDFIFFESERLSRLIANVLQLARINHRNHSIELTAIPPHLLLARISAKIKAQQEASSFQVNIIKPIKNAERIEIKVDEDAFFQIIINLVDNAIKFSANAERKQIDIGFRLSDQHKQVVFYVRDYGPGIKKQQLKKIFRLFYRPGDELTRSSPGTGIGLALVAQLAEAMDSDIDVINRHPGVEFQIKFSVANFLSD